MALGTYNRTPANRQSGAQRMYTESYALNAAMLATMGAGAAYKANFRLGGALSAAVLLHYGYDADYALAGELAAEEMAVTAHVRGAYALNGSISMRAVPALVWGGSFGLLLTARLEVAMHIAPAYPVLYGAVEAAVHIDGARETAMRFPEIVLPPGGVLVIDSDAFTAELNGENVIDQYTGDWPEITRLLTRLRVEGGTSGTLNVTVLYTERYL